MCSSDLGFLARLGVPDKQTSGRARRGQGGTGRAQTEQKMSSIHREETASLPLLPGEGPGRAVGHTGHGSLLQHIRPESIDPDQEKRKNISRRGPGG